MNRLILALIMLLSIASLLMFLGCTRIDIEQNQTIKLNLTAHMNQTVDINQTVGQNDTPSDRYLNLKTELKMAVFEQYCTTKMGYQYGCGSPLREIGCSYYYAPSEYIANLDPQYPIMICIKKEEADNQTAEGVYRFDAGTPKTKTILVIDYIIYKDKGFELIISEKRFKELFTPVESKEEAIAFLTAMNKGFIMFNMTMLVNRGIRDEHGMYVYGNGNYNVPIDSIKETNVTEVDGGFIANTYDEYGTCADEIHETFYEVRYDGTINLINQTLIWESKNKPACRDD